MISFVCDYALTSPSILINKVEELIPNSTAYFTDIDKDRFILRALVHEMDREKSILSCSTIFISRLKIKIGASPPEIKSQNTKIENAKL